MTHTHIRIHMCVYITCYIYIYIYRERERDTSVFICYPHTSARKDRIVATFGEMSTVLR